MGGSLLGVCARGQREITPGETGAGLGLGLNSYIYFLLGQLGELEERRQLLRPKSPVADREAKKKEMTCHWGTVHEMLRCCPGNLVMSCLGREAYSKEL